MRRIPLLAALVVALASVPSSAVAASAASGVSLTGGSGRVVMTLRGSVLGTLDRGKITVGLNGGGTQIYVDGTNLKQHTLVDGRVAYTGTDLRFRVFRGGWRVVIDGTGINASAGGRGLISLRGTGEYSIDGRAPLQWTSTWQAIRLGPRSQKAA